MGRGRSRELETGEDAEGRDGNGENRIEHHGVRPASGWRVLRGRALTPSSRIRTTGTAPVDQLRPNRTCHGSPRCGIGWRRLGSRIDLARLNVLCR